MTRPLRLIGFVAQRLPGGKVRRDGRRQPDVGAATTHRAVLSRLLPAAALLTRQAAYWKISLNRRLMRPVSFSMYSLSTGMILRLLRSGEPCGGAMSTRAE